MRRRLVWWTLVALLITVPLAIAGFTAGVYVVQERHNRAIAEQSHALEVLDRIDEARAILREERVEVLASRTEPLDREQLEALGQLFSDTIGEPTLQMKSAASLRLQQQIVSEHARYLAAAQALPARPAAAQVLAVRALGTRVSSLLDALRERHSADLRAVGVAEQRQRVLSRVILIVANAAVFFLVGIGFLLLQRLNRQRVRLQVLQATDQLRNELVSFAAHQLRNPASTISSGVWLLHHGETDAETRQKALDSMAESADALGRLVMNLLNMGRVEEGKLHLEREPTALPVLLDGLIGEVGAYRHDLPARLHLAVPEVSVDADPDYLRQALSNVLDNALKHSPPDSPITITGEVRDGAVVLRFHNQGAGIPPEHLGHIFEKYETYGGGRRAGRGVGLGLYMTRLLIEAHGGRVAAESKPGEGATISLTLPVAPAATAG
jgi:signal transduction histidine kinase